MLSITTQQLSYCDNSNAYIPDSTSKSIALFVVILFVVIIAKILSLLIGTALSLCFEKLCRYIDDTPVFDSITDDDIHCALYSFESYRLDILKQINRLKSGVDIENVKNTDINPLIWWSYIKARGTFKNNQFVIQTTVLKDVLGFSISTDRTPSVSEWNDFDSICASIDKKQDPDFDIEYREKSPVGPVWII